MLRVMGQLRLYFDPTGLAAARIEVRALRVVMIPAFAIETVCCSYRRMRAGELTVKRVRDEGEELAMTS